MIMKHLTLKKLSCLVARLVAVLFIGSFAMTAQAQETAEGDEKGGSVLMVGFKGGVNISEFRNNNAFDYWEDGEGSAKVLGAQFLGFLRYQANPWLAGDLEIGWSMQGGAIEAAGRFNQGAGEYTYNTHAVQANLLANVRLPIITVYKPKFFVGPSLNYNFYVNERFEGSTLIGETPIAIEQSSDATNAFEAVDFGIVMGLEFEFDLKFAALLVDARYRHGFNDLNNSRNNPIFPALRGTRSAENSGLAFNVGLGFPIGGK